MSQIKPIETFYNGFRFRSRLEARWAVLFDALGIKYLYEPQGFKLSDGTCYLPDFYLPEMNEFFEVKGQFKLTDIRKVKMFIREAKMPVVIGLDDFRFQACDSMMNGYELAKAKESILMKCNECGKYYFCGVNGGWSCMCCNHYDGDNTSEWCYNGENSDYFVCKQEEKEKVQRAIDKAKQARFEHGECG